MYMTSSTADVTNGGLEPRGLLGLSVKSGGDSSSWKAFSTERRKKKVVMALNGSMRWLPTLRCRLLLARNCGMTRPWSMRSSGCEEAHLSEMKREYRAYRPSISALSPSSTSTSFISTPSSSLVRTGAAAGELERGVPLGGCWACRKLCTRKEKA